MAATLASTYKPEERERMIRHVLGEIAKGRALSSVLGQDEGLCGYATWMRWQSESDTLHDEVTRAREAGATKLLEEIVEISDQATGEAYIAHDKNGKPYAKINGDTVQRAKLRVYAREKYAAMIAPRLYGQRLDVTSGGEKLAAPQSASLMDARVNALLLLAAHRAQQQGQAEPIMLEAEATDVDPLEDIMK